MTSSKSDETVTIRLPRGMANKIRARTGQPVSRLARVLLSAYLQNLDKEQPPAEQPSQLQQNLIDAANVVEHLKDAE